MNWNALVCLQTFLNLLGKKGDCLSVSVTDKYLFDLFLEKTTDILTNEKDVAKYISDLTSANIRLAEDFCVTMLLKNLNSLSLNRAASSPYARCLMRFLLDKKMKSHLTDIIESNKVIRTATFGQLNTYKYSLVWIMRRVFRLNKVELTTEIMELLKKNPFRDDNAPTYSERWSLKFLIDEVLSAPMEYLNLTPQSLNAIQNI